MPMKISGLLDKSCVHIILIALLGLLAYSNTFDVPFQWDDQYLIAENPIVKDLNYFLRPSEASGLGDYYSAFKSRYIGYLSFALNYRFHGLDVAGYHAVNSAIHIVAALLVYFLISLTFETPFMHGSSLRKYSGRIALFPALLFVAHPVQTEAVTYIFQRLASLAAMFYLLSVVLYARWRLASNPPSPPLSKGGTGGLYYLLSLLAAVLAMKTKENAFTLPVAIALYEFFFFSGPLRRRIFILGPFLLCLLIIPLTLVGIDTPGDMFDGIAPATRGYSGVSRIDYLLSQFRVLATYLRLTVVPKGQNVDYAYPLYKSLFDAPVFLSLLLLISLFCFAVFCFYQSRSKDSGLRLISFGIIWFFLTIAVESGIIPRPNFIAEYRMYLPVAGLFSAVTAGLGLIAVRFAHRTPIKILAALFFLFPFIFALFTYARNVVWQSRISLWEDVITKTSNNPRGHFNLALAYKESGLNDKAIEHFLKASIQAPGDLEAYNNLASAYREKGLIDEAIKYYRIALRVNPEFARAHYNLGAAYVDKGLFDEAIEQFKTALQLNFVDANVYCGLGMAYQNKGLIKEAIYNYNAALKINPAHEQARRLLNSISIHGE